jgi:cyanophycinase-like exopeptidase
MPFKPRFQLAPGVALLCAALTASVVAPMSAQAQGLPQRHLYPVGGGYETALRGFALEALKHARGPAVNLTLVPAAFADDPVLPEDPGILADDVLSLQAACDAVVNKVAFPSGCVVNSVPLYVAGDAYNPGILAVLSNPTLDGVFFTGGDQGYAMKILAQTPAESAMAVAAERGVIFGGTSAGAAIESLGMNAGYTDAGDSTNALQKASIDLWLGRPASSRGLSFGSRQVIIDEHVYSRGRLGRMINAAAQTADVLGHGGLLSLGFDYDTGGAITNDRWLSGISGVSSAVIVDLQTAHAKHRWIGPQAALSARHVLAHLVPPHAAVGFDLVHRTPVVSGRPLAWRGDALPGLTLQSEYPATLILGGDVSQDLGGPVIRELVRLASSRQRLGQFIVVAAGYATLADAQAEANTYTQALLAAGWRGSTRTFLHGQSPLDSRQLKDVSGVLFLGGDQSLLGGAVADPLLRAFVGNALHEAQVVMLDHAMAAAAGDHFDAIGEDDSADSAIAAFLSRNAVVKPGLGLVHGASFEPRLQVDMRWGRLFGVGARRPQSGVYGISESSAIVLHGRQAKVLGLNPVVSLDARQATFMTGDNGTLGAFNVLLDVHEPQEDLND